VAYEIERQKREWQQDHDYTLEKKGRMNFGWDDAREVTEFQRGKEESHDYRYFPDPDLVPVTTDAATIERLRSEMGELPAAKQARFVREYGLTAKDCEVILADAATGQLFDDAIKAGADPPILAKQFLGVWNHIASAKNLSIGSLGIVAKTITELAALVADGSISAGAALQVAEKLLPLPPGEGRGEGQSARDIAQSLGLIQERDSGALEKWIDEAFAANPQAVADALSGNPKKAQAAPGFLRGQVMKISGGKADPKLTGQLIEQKLAQRRSANG
ncbi:MAG TPA: hypothetical protein VMV81_01595, partial [Phycisphaerae bacterium]|nr:hypothetical protein [Phycisphaerae bacterium]